MNNVIIVGWGLAGATIAWQLHLRKIPFQVIDNGNNQSSHVAAGLVNPIVFKRLTKSWQADILMPYAENFYAEIESKVQVKLLSRKNIFSVFSSVEDENNWAVKNGDDRFKNFLGATNHTKIKNVSCDFGLGEVKTFGNLNTLVYLNSLKNYFIQNGVDFSRSDFNFDVVHKTRETQYIFCEGYHIKDNPLFNYLPMKPTHGEVLIIEAKNLNIDFVLSKNMFVLPLGNSLFKIGATYNWELGEPTITVSAKTELLAKLEKIITCDYKIISHMAGVRPTVSDRRPLLGTHPSQKNAHIFNGLGTKGVMIAPYYSAHLINHLIDGVELEKEVDIGRFEGLFHDKS